MMHLLQLELLLQRLLVHDRVLPVVGRDVFRFYVRPLVSAQAPKKAYSKVPRNGLGKKGMYGQLL